MRATRTLEDSLARKSTLGHRHRPTCACRIQRSFSLNANGGYDNYDYQALGGAHRRQELLARLQLDAVAAHQHRAPAPASAISARPIRWPPPTAAAARCGTSTTATRVTTTRDAVPAAGDDRHGRAARPPVHAPTFPTRSRASRRSTPTSAPPACRRRWPTTSTTSATASCCKSSCRRRPRSTRRRPPRSFSLNATKRNALSPPADRQRACSARSLADLNDNTTQAGATAVAQLPADAAHRRQPAAEQDAHRIAGDRHHRQPDAGQPGDDAPVAAASSRARSNCAATRATPSVAGGAHVPRERHQRFPFITAIAESSTAMYETYYGLSAKPFRLRPDPAFLLRQQGPQARHGLPRLRPVAGRGLHRHHRRSRRRQDHAGAQPAQQPAVRADHRRPHRQHQPRFGRHLAHGGVGLRPAVRKRQQARPADPARAVPARSGPARASARCWSSTKRRT